jgi:hypothetical protein
MPPPNDLVVLVNAINDGVFVTVYNARLERVSFLKISVPTRLSPSRILS